MKGKKKKEKKRITVQILFTFTKNNFGKRVRQRDVRNLRKFDFISLKQFSSSLLLLLIN